MNAKEPNAAAFAPGEVLAREIRVGDMVAGPNYYLVRIAKTEEMAGGEVGLWYTDFDATQDWVFEFGGVYGRGFPPEHPLFVVARGISKDAVQVYKQEE